jgi:hypothetical protein
MSATKRFPLRTVNSRLPNCFARCNHAAWMLTVFPPGSMNGPHQYIFVSQIGFRIPAFGGFAWKSKTPSASSTRGQHISLSSSIRLSEGATQKSRLLEESACRRPLDQNSLPNQGIAVDPAGFEPAPSSLTGRYATNYTTGPKTAYGQWGDWNKIQSA